MKTMNNWTVRFGWLFLFLVVSDLNAQETVQGRPLANFESFQNACVSPNRECVPASILNSLQLGRQEFSDVFSVIPGKNNAEKLANTVRRLRMDDSTVFDTKKLCGEDGLVYVEDTTYCYNCILKEYSSQPLTVFGEFANRIDGESRDLHLKRVHSNLTDSIAAGVPPLVSLCLFVADGAESEKNLHWNGTNGHTIVIVGVNPIQKWNRSGFAFQYLDSIDGQLSEGYAFLEKRLFNAPQGSHPATKVDLYDCPYLLVVAPALELGDSSLAWHRRSVVHLTFMVGEFAPSKTRNTTLKSMEKKLEFKPAPFPFDAKN